MIAPYSHLKKNNIKYIFKRKNIFIQNSSITTNRVTIPCKTRIITYNVTSFSHNIIWDGLKRLMWDAPSQSLNKAILLALDVVGMSPAQRTRADLR